MTFSIEEIVKEVYEVNDTIEQKTIEELRSETFENIGRVHDWRNYTSIPGLSRWSNKKDLEKGLKMWQDLSDLGRLLIYAQAANQADREEWD